MYLLAELLPVFHGPKHRVDSFIVRDIIALIFQGRLENRRQPEHVNPNSFKVVKPLDYALKVANSVTVAVLEGLNVDFIDYDLPPPNAVQVQDHGLIQVGRRRSPFLCRHLP